MPRLAGDEPGYRFSMMRKGPGGSLTASPFGFELTSVTTILSEVIPKPFAAGAWHGYRLALEAVKGRDLRHIPDLEAKLSSEGRNPNQYLDSTRDRGFIAHDVLELFCAGEDEMAFGVCIVETELYGTSYGMAVASWWSQQVVSSAWKKKVLSERPVWSLSKLYAGTADIIVPGVEILDLKTHKPARGFTLEGQGPAYLSDLIQVRAYRMAWEEMGNKPVKGNRIVIARSNGKFLEDTREVPEELWLKALEMYPLLTGN